MSQKGYISTKNGTNNRVPYLCDGIKCENDLKKIDYEKLKNIHLGKFIFNIDNERSFWFVIDKCNTRNNYYMTYNYTNNLSRLYVWKYTDLSPNTFKMYYKYHFDKIASNVKSTIVSYKKLLTDDIIKLAICNVIANGILSVNKVMTEPSSFLGHVSHISYDDHTMKLFEFIYLLF